MRTLAKVVGRAACVAVCLGTIVGASAQTYVSPMAIVPSPDGLILYVAGETANQVVVVDLASEAVTGTIPVPDPPVALAISADGSRLFVAGASPQGKVHIVNTAAGAVEATIPVGHTPSALALSPDASTLYVCNRFDTNVGVVDLSSGQQAATIDVLREPVAAALTPDGALLAVVNHLPSQAADLDYVAAVVTIIDTAARSVAAGVQLVNGSTGLRGVCVSPDGKYAYVTHLLGRYQLPTTQLERGWMNTNAVSIIDLEQKSLLNTVLIDDVDAGSANPWGVVCTPDGRYLCVTHAGIHEVSIIDRGMLHDKLARVAAGEPVSDVSKSPDDVPNDLSFLVGMRRRLRLAGNGPRGLALAGGKAYAAEYFTDSLGVVDLDPQAYHHAKSIPLAPAQEMSVARKGQMFFNDAQLCFQNWQSCASCHPDDRVDGFNWDLLNDGMGNPKNTKSMLLAHQTPPAMVSGVRGSAEVAVRSGIKFIQFAVRPEEDAVAIDEYLKNLKPVPSPLLVDGALGEAAVRGQAVFESAGCAACHPAPLYTDLALYDVGTGTGREEGMAFDTPALVEVWRTAPYMHDGRNPTIQDLLTNANAGSQHCMTGVLNEEQINDLTAFLLSL